MINYKNKINMLLLFVVTALFLFGTTGCFKKKKKKTQKGQLEITSNVKGATIYVNGKKSVKKTPLEPVAISPGYYLLKFEKEGFKTSWQQVHVQKGHKTLLHVKLAPITASVVIKSTPTATVTYNGDVIGATPITLDNLPLGKHSATITQLGYTPQTLSWSITSERPQLLRINLDSNMGHLSLSSTLDGANLSIDGEKRGTLPFEGEIAQGQHTIKVEKQGHATLEEVLLVKKGETTKRAVNLQLLPGELTVISEPRADVSVNGKAYGLTPLNLKDLPPGEYTIKIIHDGFDPYELKANISPGQHLEKNINLSSNTGGIDIVVLPAGVTIYLDGKKVGVSKAMADNPKLTEVFKIRNLSAGNHELTFAHKLARPETKVINVTIKKREIKRLKRCTMWVANYVLRLKDDPRPMEGILISETKKMIIFSSEPGITQDFDRKLILSLKPLKREE